MTAAVGNKKELPLMIAGFALLIVLFLWGKGIYNDTVVMDESVKTAWSQVENQYQRRLDLIPNLVNTVKGYAAHEQATFENIAAARAAVGKTTLDPSAMSEADLQRFQAAQGELSSALSRLLVVSERYPQLQASNLFRDLQAQLEGTENRISVERKRFNDTAQQYNAAIRSFPTSLVAGLLGFRQRPYFTAQTGAQQAPQVNFP